MGGAGPPGLLQVPSQDAVGAAGYLSSGKGILSKNTVPGSLGDIQSGAGGNGTYGYVMRPRS